MTDTEQRNEAIARVLLGVVLLPVSAIAAAFVISMVWLSYGLAGFILVGLAGAAAFIGPFGVLTGYKQYQEATNGCA